jgi:stage II sporulation protein D
MVAANEPPIVSSAATPQGQRLAFPAGVAVPIALSANGWRIGNITYGSGELTVQPAQIGSVSVNGQSYRGQYRLVPVAAGKFDVVNDVNIDDYLKSVVSKELLWNWHEEAYRAQAIVARTYALYEWRMAGTGRHWDLYPDQRSQVYGGLAAETAKSRDAVDFTRGVVVAYGPEGQEKIFKAYFSSCCGGISQSGADAFGEPYIEPLSDQNNGSTCNASPKFNWGPIVIRKDELTRRFRLWGEKKNRIEKNMAEVSRIDIQAVNRFGRPTRFQVTDARGTKYSWTGEELRWAVNTSAQEGTTLNSSFCKIINAPDAIHFVEGHGWGHGVGMCQWCAQRRALDGMQCEDIVLAAYLRARLVRAY